MRLKLDLHPIYNDSRSIEEALQGILDEAVTKRATEVEIIPGKGSGALKKAVIRFLDRPDVKSRYHRMEKDGDNWGRLFVHFRHDRPEPGGKPDSVAAVPTISAPCVCCGEPIPIPIPESDAMDAIHLACAWCGSPHRISFWRDGRQTLHARAQLDYGAA